MHGACSFFHLKACTGDKDVHANNDTAGGQGELSPMAKEHRGQIRSYLRKADLRGVPRTGQTGRHVAEDANREVHLGKSDKTRNGGGNPKEAKKTL